jgi:hypothetical protein
VKWNYHWRASPAVEQLEETVEQLRADNVRLRHDLTNKAGYAAKLELVLHQRMERIDQLQAAIDLLRQRNQHLDLENHCLTALLAAPDAAMLAPK